MRYKINRLLWLATLPVCLIPTLALAQRPAETVAKPDTTRKLHEVSVVGATEKRRLERSADAVTIIETKELRYQSADMGQVLAQTQGVGVRRSGGLGSQAEFSLAGLTGNQVRFFLDGLPLELQGYTFGLSTVPVGLVDRIEIYKGVVPIAFGADALGGAVNIVSPKPISGTHGGASYQIGSFGTHRTTAQLGYTDTVSGWFVAGDGYYDQVQNDYRVHVNVADERGREIPVVVPRFHDRYSAGGANVSVGVRGKPFADELRVRGFFHRYLKEIQHNELMAGIPYGEVTTFRNAYGTALNYNVSLGPAIDLRLSAGYSRAEREFVDTSRNVYDWHGNVVLVKNRAGEIAGGTTGGAASQLFTYTHSTYARLSAGWTLSPQGRLQLSVAPTQHQRTGDDHLLQGYDPNTAERRLLGWVNGLSYTYGGDRNPVEYTAFVKYYSQRIHSEEPSASTAFTEVSKKAAHWGAGSGLRYRITDRWLAKTSYEYATRLPQENELFGDGQFTLENLELLPERSHNINLGLALTNPLNQPSTWQVQANGFMRVVDQLILFVPGTERTSRYENVLAATSVGVEVEGSWISPGGRLHLGANATYQDFYNSSNEGIFAPFRGDRIPNRPYLFANGSARYHWTGLFTSPDQLAVFGYAQYIASFYRSWESAGIRAYKPEIPAQQSISSGASYRSTFGTYHYVVTGEVQNLTGQRNYDYLGVEKPGRAFYLKLSITF